MIPALLSDDAFRPPLELESRMRLQTIVRLRWLAVLGQILAVSVVSAGFGFPLPMGPCLFLISLSAWLNVFLSIRYPARHRLSVRFATATLAYDILQLAALLYLTGGIVNPFAMLLVAPVTVSAATLPLKNTMALGLLAIASAVVITLQSQPLPWSIVEELSIPPVYRMGMLAAVVSSITFLALYAWRISKEGRLMSAALAATELVLAREQKLHALDGLAAAAAHELGTPLSTIYLVTSEMQRQTGADHPQADDISLLKDQAKRCREILQKLTRRNPEEQDPLHSIIPVEEMLNEAAGPYHGGRVPIVVTARPAPDARPGVRREPVGARRPGVIYGLGNIIENATDFAATRVDIAAEWTDEMVTVTVMDDGPGFQPEVIDSIGEPYVTTRPLGHKKGGGSTGHKASGLGLGFFIAKTLLERSGARLALENRSAPQHGAVVRIIWRRTAFEAPLAAGEQEIVGTS